MNRTALVADDITVEALERDPYPIYARLRHEAPVCYVPAVDLWFVTRWADVVEAAEDPVRFPASMPGTPLDRTLGGVNVLTVDGAQHAALRGPMEPSLRPRSIAESAPEMVERIGNELIEGFADRGEAELMSEYCEPLSVLTLAEHIGLQELDAPTLRLWFHGLATGTSNYEADPEKQRVADRTSAEIDRAIRPYLEDLLQRPDGTMLSDMLHGAPGNLNERMARFVPTLKLALIGGLQEPGHGIGSTVYGLLSNQEQAAAFRTDPAELVKRAVDEGLRWVSPIGTQGRAAGTGAVLEGVEIPEGAPVGLIVPSANRDEEVWGPTADVFDLRRPHRAHAGFGFGPHFCVGHSLARVQVRTGVRLLFERLPGLRLDPDQRAEFRGWEYRGPAHLQVRWDV